MFNRDVSKFPVNFAPLRGIMRVVSTCQVMNTRLPNHQFTADPFPLCLFGLQQVKAGGEFARR